MRMLAKKVASRSGRGSSDAFQLQSLAATGLVLAYFCNQPLQMAPEFGFSRLSSLLSRMRSFQVQVNDAQPPASQCAVHSFPFRSAI